MLDTVKNALTRKFGPLPAWAWLGILGFGYYYYQKHYGSGAVSGTGTGSVTPTPPTPQDPVTLDPGQSVYDPNTGALDTAPGGDSSGGSNGTDVGSALEDLANAIQGALNQANSPVGTAPSTSSKPKGKRKIKKPKIGKPKVAKPKHPKNKKRPRGKTSISPKTGGRLWGRIAPKGTKRPTSRKSNVTVSDPGFNGNRPVTVNRKTASELRSVSRARDRTKTPATRTVVRQRPIATHAAPRRASAPPSHPARRRHR